MDKVTSKTQNKMIRLDMKRLHCVDSDQCQFNKGLIEL